MAAAIVLSAALLWTAVGSGVSLYRRDAKRALLDVHASVTSMLLGGDTVGAYAFTTEDYRASHSLEEFRSAFGHLSGKSSFLRDPPCVLDLGFDSAAVGNCSNPEDTMYSGPALFYRKEHGRWLLTGEQAWYVD